MTALGGWSTPDELLDEVRGLAPLVAGSLDAIERDRCLPDPLVAELRRLGIFRLAVPNSLGGPQLDPLTHVRVVEELSRQSGSVGWCAMIAIAASYASGFFSPEAGQRWYGGADSCIAGQIAPVGRATVVDGGYRLDGRYRFASGVGHATAVIAGGVVYDDGGPVKRSNGAPRTVSALLPLESCEVLDTWHTTGLAGTGSNDYVIDDVFVPEADTYDPSGAMRLEAPLYSYPPLFLCPHVGVPLGIARAAIDDLVAMMDTKDLLPGTNRDTPSRPLSEDGRAQEALARAEGTLGAARAHAYENLGELWATMSRGDKPSRRQGALYRIMMTQAHETARDIVTSMYNTGSGDAIYRVNPLDRHLRDISTACQHRMVNQKIYQPAGRVLLGKPSGDPFV